MRSIFVSALLTVAMVVGATTFSMAQDWNRGQTKTVRLLYPQWLIGVGYPMDAQILAWLAPQSDAPLLESTCATITGTPASLEDGIVGRSAIMHSMRAANQILNTNRPVRVITFGGDCLVSQTPFAYLNERYDGNMGVLWIDAHPDVSTPRNYHNAHAMALDSVDARLRIIRSTRDS